MAPKNPKNNPNQPKFLDSLPLEASAPLESSTPLEFREEVTVVLPANRSTEADLSNLSQVQAPVVEGDRGHYSAVPADPSLVNTYERPATTLQRQSQPLATPKVAEEVVVQLLEERLVVDRQRRKIGEVIVRKEIETHIVEVPVRREKLIIEQVGLEARQLAVLDLKESDLDGVSLANHSTASLPTTVSGTFTSIKAASQFLGTIASAQSDLDCQTVQIKLVVEGAEQAQLYQQWFDRYSNNSASVD
jgi:stress response protein YsnF